jgi:glycosyltransferase involved in cell wall biosynthesis
LNPKILFILHFPPPVHGAAMVGQYIRESETINNAFDGRYINLGTSRSIDEIGKGGIIKLWRYFVLLWETAFTILSFRPDLVYLTLTSKGGGFYKDALVAIKAKALGAKMVYHFHNKGVSTRQDKWLDNILYKMVFKNADVILLSEHLYADIQKYVPKNRVHICPNGIPEIIQSSKFKTHKEVAATVEILFLSNLIESKGVYVLLEACKILKEKGLDFLCTYVGGEGDISEEELKQRIEKSALSELVHYAGKKYGVDKAEIFLKADIFTLPTYYPNECLPLVLLEAMQFSLPVVSSFEGGIPNLVEDGKTGFLVPQNNAVALAEKLEFLIKNPNLCKEMGELGRKKYEAEFTLAAFEARFTTILKELVK